MNTPQAAGMVVFEDEQVWLIRPKGAFGGYRWTFPKGHRDGAETYEQAAHRELAEETGLAAVIVSRLGDYPGDTTVTRFYRALRTGGDPLPNDPTDYTPGGRESAAVGLVPVPRAFVLLNRTRDRQVLADAVTC